LYGTSIDNIFAAMRQLKSHVTWIWTLHPYDSNFRVTRMFPSFLPYLINFGWIRSTLLGIKYWPPKKWRLYLSSR